MNPRNLLIELDDVTLGQWLKENNEPLYRKKQILDWIYKNIILNPNAMTNIPNELCLKLEKDFVCCSSKIQEELIATDGTKKLIIKLFDGNMIESVILRAKTRLTFCLSTQVGCPVQCVFCKSGEKGLIRNMTSSEILEQFFLTCEKAGGIPNNIVFMGIGEGLLNFKHLTKALDILCDKNKINFASRKITISTSGITKGIKKLADLEQQWNLAISIHAPDDKLRSKLIPDKFREPLCDILEASRYYRHKTSRMVTFEYALMKNINDDKQCALKLAKIAKENRAKVNLIPYNSTSNNEFIRPNKQQISNFKSILEKEKIQVTLRSEKGSDIIAACGQLGLGNTTK